MGATSRRGSNGWLVAEVTARLRRPPLGGRGPDASSSVCRHAAGVQTRLWRRGPVSTDARERLDSRNPVGCGHAVSSAHLANQPVPNIEAPERPTRAWKDLPAPAGFGPIASHWQPRAALAGTYDKAWEQTRQPLLPDDCDDRFFQCAPIDQQTAEFLVGGEAVTLLNLSPLGRLDFALPVMSRTSVSFCRWRCRTHERPRLHSVIFEPDFPRVSLVWHSALECHAKMHKLDSTRIRWHQPGSDVGSNESVESLLTSFEPGMVIAGLGAATAIGRGALASAAAVRGGVSGFSAHRYMVDSVGLPMRITDAWIDPESGIVERIGDALVSAVDEALAPLPERGRQAPISLLINLPGRRPGMPANLGQRIGVMVDHQFPGVFDRVGMALLGHAGALVGLRTASAILQEQPHRFCVVAGADSYIEPDLLEWLERTDQLHSAGERNNAWGLIPGEGAGALLLGAPETLNRFESVPIGRYKVSVLATKPS